MRAGFFGWDILYIEIWAEARYTNGDAISILRSVDRYVHHVSEQSGSEEEKRAG